MSTTIDAAIIETLTNHIDNDPHQNLTAEKPLWIQDNKILLAYDSNHFDVSSLGTLINKPSANGLYTWYPLYDNLIFEDSNAKMDYVINKAIPMKEGDILRLYSTVDNKVHSFFITVSDIPSQGKFKATCIDDYSGTNDYFYIDKRGDEYHYDIMASDFVPEFMFPLPIDETRGGYYTISSTQFFTDLKYIIDYLTKNN